MTRRPASIDIARLDDALHVLHGEEGTGTIRRLLYAFYLVAIFGGVYGFNLLRALLVTSDPQWVRSAAQSVWGVLALLATSAALTALAWATGRVRGPVVPPLPFIDSVVASAIDRAEVLRERALALLIAGAGVGALIGALVGGAVVGAGLGGVAAVIVTIVAATTLGLLVAVTALLAQAADSDGLRRDTRAADPASRHRLTVANLLRSLRLEQLRVHAVRTTHIGGAVLAGDLRAARLDVAAPITRARNRRLRPGSPILTVVRRDLLGLRRTPRRAVAGLLGLGAAYALIAVAAGQPAAPRILGLLALVVAYFAFGALAEGVRLVADNAGTPPLIGLAFRTEAAAHLVIPVLGALVIGLPVVALVSGATGLDPRIPLGAAGAATLILAGTTLMAAFRGSPPDLSFVAEVGPMTMAYWYARPVTVAAFSGGLPLAALADRPLLAPLTLGFVLGAGVFTIWYGLRLARQLELGHRI